MKKIFNKTLIVASTTVTLFITVLFVAFAAEGIKYNLLAPFGDTKEVSTFSSYLGSAIPFILSMAAVFAVVQIVIGGFQYALSEAMGTKQDAKDRMTQAIIGLVLALASYLILNTINPNLVKLNIGIKNISEIVKINNIESNNLPDIKSRVGATDMVICGLGGGVCRTDYDATMCSQKNGKIFNPSQQMPCPEGAPITNFFDPITNISSPPFTCSSYVPTNKYSCQSTGRGMYWSMQRCAPGCSGDSDYFETAPFGTEQECQNEIQKAEVIGMPPGTLFRCIYKIRE